MASILEGVFTFLIIVVFGIWMYSLLTRKDFMEVLKDLKKLIFENE